MLFIVLPYCRHFQFYTLKLSNSLALARCKFFFRVIETDKSFIQSGDCQHFFMAQGGVVKASKNFLKEKEINSGRGRLSH